MHALAPQAAQRIERLIAAMTLTEKAGQLSMRAAGDVVTGPAQAQGLLSGIRSGAVGHVLNVLGSEVSPSAQTCHELQRVALEESRLGIPLIIALDVTHGYRTLFPVCLGEAGLLDEATWELSAREAAAEAAAAGISMTFAPMVDVSRDPRWGRGVEGAGEDPWVTSQFAAAKVRGFQGRDLANPQQVAAVAKHYLGYGAVTAGREYASVELSQRTLLEVHLPAFAAAIRAGVAGIMPGFHDLAGCPMTAHRHWLIEQLRGELGFKGVMVSDYNAIGELLQHGVAASLAECATLALRAGVDIDMMSGAYEQGLPEALERGWITEAQIDAAVRRVLTLKTRLGLLDDPYARGRDIESPEAITSRRALAREVAARSLVLLRHREDVLPLADPGGPICVLGPLADAPAQMRGPWPAACGPNEPISVLQALRELPWEIRHASGVDLDSEDTSRIPDALSLLPGARTVLLCLGEAALMSGEAASRARLDLPGAQRQLAEAVLDHAHGIPVIVVLFSGRPLTVGWLAGRVDALLAAWFPGSQAGPAIVDVLSGRVSPVGRTTVSWPREVGQVPVFFAQRPSGRPAGPQAGPFTSRYLDLPNEPLFPFGHGESYGSFKLTRLRVAPTVLRAHDIVEVWVEVLNEGRHPAEETIFVFTRDPVASVARPLLELRAVGHITLKPGEQESLHLSFPVSTLSFLDSTLTPVLEPGEIEVLAGPCAQRSRLLGQSVRILP